MVPDISETSQIETRVADSTPILCRRALQRPRQPPESPAPVRFPLSLVCSDELFFRNSTDVMIQKDAPASSLTHDSHVHTGVRRWRSTSSGRRRGDAAGSPVFSVMPTVLLMSTVAQVQAQLPAVDDVPRLWPQPASVTTGGGSGANLALDPDTFKIVRTPFYTVPTPAPRAYIAAFQLLIPFHSHQPPTPGGH